MTEVLLKQRDQNQQPMQALKIALDAEVGENPPDKQFIKRKLSSKELEKTRQPDQNIKPNQSEKAFISNNLLESIDKSHLRKQASQTDYVSGFRAPSIWTELASGAATKAREKYRSHQASIARLAALEQKELQRKAQASRFQKPSDKHLYVSKAVLSPLRSTSQIHRVKPLTINEDNKKIHQNKATEGLQVPVNRYRQSFVEFAGGNGEVGLRKISPLIINRGTSDIISSSSTDDDESRYSEIVLERHLSKESHLKKVLDCRQGLPSRMTMLGSRGIRRTDSEYYKSKGLNPDFMSSDDSNTSDGQEKLFKGSDSEEKHLVGECQTNSTSLKKRAIKIPPNGYSPSTEKQEKRWAALKCTSGNQITEHHQSTKHTKHEARRFDCHYIPHLKCEKNESVLCEYCPRPALMYCMYPAGMVGYMPSWCPHNAPLYCNPTCHVCHHQMVLARHHSPEAHYSDCITAPQSSVKFAHISR